MIMSLVMNRAGRPLQQLKLVRLEFELLDDDVRLFNDPENIWKFESISWSLARCWAKYVCIIKELEYSSM